jgi:serine/threonine-protein kinase RsbW
VEKASLKFDIASDLAASRDVQRAVLDALAAHGYSDNAIFAVKLSLEEALVNAIKHGNKLDPGKRVRVAAEIDNRQCQIVIEDQGPGFDRSAVPDPTAEENLTKCSGRGLLLIEAYMNKVEYSKGGRRVRLLKVNDNVRK